MFRMNHESKDGDKPSSTPVMGLEARDDIYHAARRQHATRVSKKESEQTHQHYIKRAWEQMVTYGQLFVVCYALYWLFHNQGVVLGWWEGLLDLFKRAI